MSKGVKTETLKELRRHFRAIEVALQREIEEREQEEAQTAKVKEDTQAKRS